jgi:hypothetical protein
MDPTATSEVCKCEIVLLRIAIVIGLPDPVVA